MDERGTKRMHAIQKCTRTVRNWNNQVRKLAVVDTCSFTSAISLHVCREMGAENAIKRETNTLDTFGKGVTLIRVIRVISKLLKFGVASSVWQTRCGH